MSYYNEVESDDEFDGHGAERTKELLINDYVWEEEMGEEITVTFTRRELICLYYTCAESEMLHRERSIGMRDGYARYFNEDGTPRYDEDECRAEMKAARRLQGRVSEVIPNW